MHQLRATPCRPAANDNHARCPSSRSRPSIVSSDEFDSDKESLLRMLHDFDRDHARRVGATEPSPLEDLLSRFRCVDHGWLLWSCGCMRYRFRCAD